MCSNYYTLYSAGFGMWCLMKGTLSMLVVTNLSQINKNISSNAGTVCDKLWLLDDGMSVKISTMQQGNIKKISINYLRPLSKEQLAHLLSQENEFDRPNIEKFHAQYMPLFAVS